MQTRAGNPALPSVAPSLDGTIVLCPFLAVILAGWLVSIASAAIAAEERRTTVGSNPLGSTTWIERVEPPPAPNPRTSPIRPPAESNAGANIPVLRERPASQGRTSPDVPPVNAPRRAETGTRQAGALSSVVTRESFRGMTYNETLGRSGGLRLVVTRVGPGDAVLVRFEASGGLIGTGQLSGSLFLDGRLIVSGTLMMGRNPFATELDGMMFGEGLVGEVRYRRITEIGGRSSSTRGTFELTRG